MKNKIIVFHVITVIPVITSVIFPRRKTVATTDFEVVREKSIMVLPRQRVKLGRRHHKLHAGHGQGPRPVRVSSASSSEAAPTSAFAKRHARRRGAHRGERADVIRTVRSVPHATTSGGMCGFTDVLSMRETRVWDKK